MTALAAPLLPLLKRKQQVSDKIEIRIAFPLDDEFEALTDRAVELAGRVSDWSGGGASWAGRSMRDMGWECNTFEEALTIRNAIKDCFPDWPINIREKTSNFVPFMD